MPTLNKIYRYTGTAWVEVLDFAKFYLASNPSGYTTNKGTVTSVGAGTGLSISGTPSVNPTINVDSGYKLPTTTEWNNKADISALDSYLPLAGGTMTGGITLNNDVHLSAKHTNNDSYNIIYVNNQNNIIFGSTGFRGIYSYNSIHPLTTNTYDLGTSTRQWNNIYGKILYEDGTKLSSKYALISHTHSFANITGRYDTLLNFSVDAPSLNGSISPIGMSLSLARSACRTDFINGDAITIERSDDGGSTWTTVNNSVSEKRALFTTNIGLQLYNGNSGNATLNSQCRVTLTAQDGTTGEAHRYLYTNPKKMLIQYSSPHSGQVLVEKRSGANYQSDGAWVTVGTYYIGGWSGWNEIPLVMNTLGGSVTQTGNYWQLRLTFSFTSINSSYLNIRSSATNILIFGDNDWGRASAVAGFGPISGTSHLYSYDINANATFPAAINATSVSAPTLIENGTALSDKYLALTGGIVNGAIYFNTNTNTTPVTIRRGDSDFEAIKIGVDDSSVRFNYTNDEKASSILFYLNNTDTENSDGSDASSHYVTFTADKNEIRVSLDGTIITNKTALYENGTALSSKYLGISATAADSSKLGGVAASSYATQTYVDDAIAAAITTVLNTPV